MLIHDTSFDNDSSIQVKDFFSVICTFVKTLSCSLLPTVNQDDLRSIEREKGRVGDNRKGERVQEFSGNRRRFDKLPV